jgi:hypothetical protein
VLGGGVVAVVAVVVRVVGGRVRDGKVVVVVVGDGVIGVAVRGAVAAVGRGVPGARRRRRSWMRRWMIILLAAAVAVRSRVRVLLGVPTVLPRNTMTLARISI